MIAKIWAFLQGTVALLRGDPNGFLWLVSGVIHVGANSGQERHLYEKHGLPVVWIEPIPEVFETLKANIVGFPRQRACRSLVTDRDGVEYQFHVANNDGASSSILEMHLHKDLWPEVAYDRTFAMRSTTLASLLEKERIEPGKYDALIMDTQGSELLVLKGAIPVLRQFRYIRIEVPDFEAYVGCCQLPEIASFMERFGYKECLRQKFVERTEGGSYFEIVYRKK